MRRGTWKTYSGRQCWPRKSLITDRFPTGKPGFGCDKAHNSIFISAVTTNSGVVYPGTILLVSRNSRHESHFAASRCSKRPMTPELKRWPIPSRSTYTESSVTPRQETGQCAEMDLRTVSKEDTKSGFSMITFALFFPCAGRILVRQVLREAVRHLVTRSVSSFSAPGKCSKEMVLRSP